ncbi:MAG: Crp/Fnr family transcriptional regulator [Campylobacteraceae bacterium]|nr:Crp/Fnr family transcriptional regulator [Campylobacteraceae bacterium]
MVSTIPIFKNLNLEELNKLRDMSTLKKYNKGEIFFYEGEEPKTLDILVKGRLKLYKTSPKGKEVFLHDIKPINLIAELTYIENIPYPASSVFLENSEVLRINSSEFRKEFSNHHEITSGLLRSVSQKLKTMNQAFRREAVLDSESKVAHFICENFEAFISLKYSQIADMLNLTPETFSRTITKFKKSNLLITNLEGKIIGFDEEGLKEYFIA